MAEKWNEEKKERIGINCALLSYSTRNDVCQVLGNFSVVLEKNCLYNVTRLKLMSKGDVARDNSQQQLSAHLRF